MKKMVMLAFIIMSVIPALKAQESEKTAVKVKAGQAAPQFRVTMLDGSTVSTADLKGKVVLVNFWATWCGPCQAEFQNIQKDVIDRYAGQDFVLLAISRGETAETVAKFMKDKGYRFNVGLDPDKTIYELFATMYIPRNFVIDRRGKIVYSEVGYNKTDFAKVLNQIDKSLKKK